MKRITLTCLILMFVGSMFAQAPENSYYFPQWWVGAFSNTSAITCQLYIDGELQDGLNWEFGVYNMDPDAISYMEDHGHNNVVGYALPLTNPLISDHPYYMVYWCSDPGQVLNYKLYNHDTGEETDYITPLQVVTVTNGQIGSLDEFYEFHFYTAKDMVFEGIEDNLWSNPANWTADGSPVGRLPQNFENVTIAADCLLDMDAEAATVTVNEGIVLTVDGEYTLNGETFTDGFGNVVESEPSQLTIKDGAQFFAPAGSTFVGTLEKNILGYGNGSGNYYFVSVPTAEFDIETGFEAAGMLEGDYDLYFFTQNPDMAGEIDPEDDETWWFGEWQNYKFYMNPDMGMEGFTDGYQLNYAYLYANKVATTLAFNCTFYSGNGQYTCLNASSSEWPGYQLVGNPFPCNTTITAGNKIGGYYMMNQEGRSDVIPVEDPVVAPATALLIQTASGNPATARRVTFVPATEEATVRSMGNPRINIEVLSNDVLQDRAYVRMYESENLSKFSLKNEGAKLFIPQNNKQFAAVYAGEAKVMPVSFTTTENGTYTLNINPENMTCSYLHLIDNMTGADVDLLSTSTYTFEANNNDYSSRFKLIFAEEATNEIAESFVYINNGNLIINNDGAARLQLMDATGRILSVEDINGSYSKSLNLSAGVYIVRLLNGVDVKTQKIVVE